MPKENARKNGGLIQIWLDHHIPSAESIKKLEWQRVARAHSSRNKTKSLGYQEIRRLCLIINLSVCP